MIGEGCPWNDVCKANKDSYTKKNYCSNDFNFKNCPYRPLNAGDDNVLKKYRSGKRNHSDANLGKLLIVGVIIVVLLYWLL